MCGPLVASCFQPHTNRVAASVRYNLGRLISYTAAGALIARLLRETWHHLSGLGRITTVTLGLFLLAQGAKLLWRGQRSSFSLAPQATNIISSYISRTLRHLGQSWREFALGAATVMFPCMTLTPALAAAAASGSSTSGALTMLAFALGTIPIMSIAAIVPDTLRGRMPANVAMRLAGLFLILTGWLTVNRGWN